MKPVPFGFWIRACSFGPVLFLMIFAGFFFTDSWVVRWISQVAVSVLTVLCTLGALMGILFALGKLRLGCPFCSAPSPFIGGNRKSLYIECPQCGVIRGMFSHWPPLTCRIEKMEEDESIDDG